MYAHWESGEGGKSLARRITEQASKGKKKKMDAVFIGENEDRRCCAVGEDVAQAIICK